MIPMPRSIAVTEGTGHVRCRIDWACGCVTWLWRYLWMDEALPWSVDRVHWCDTHRRDTSLCVRGTHAWETVTVHGSRSRPHAYDHRCIHCGTVTTVATIR